MYLLDTNLFLRLESQPIQGSKEARAAVGALRLRSDKLCYTPQNLIECWAVATRPITANGLGYSVPEAMELSQVIIDNYTLLPDTPEIIGRWRELVVKHSVVGKKVHDARLVAVMLAHGVARLLTFDTDDFARYDEIEAVAPGDVAA